MVLTILAVQSSNRNLRDCFASSNRGWQLIVRVGLLSTCATCVCHGQRWFNRGCAFSNPPCICTVSSLLVSREVNSLGLSIVR